MAAGVQSIYELKEPHLDSDGLSYELSSDAASDEEEQIDIVLDRTTKPAGLDQQTSQRIAQSLLKQRRALFTLR